MAICCLLQMGASLQTHNYRCQNDCSNRRLMHTSCSADQCHVDSCRDCQKGNDARGNFALQHHVSHEDEVIIAAPLNASLSITFDFEGRGAVASGWRCAENITVPSGFRYMGGDACVIEDLSSQRRRVLVALPEWAVDINQTRWLIKLRDGPKTLVRLRNVELNHDTAILEFGFPRGESVAQRCKEFACMGEAEACKLCRELVELLTSLRPTPFHLGGLLDVSLVFLTQSSSLSCILPLACLLSLQGWHAAALSVLLHTGPGSLSPEIISAVAGNGIVSCSTQLRFASDSYAIAALVRTVLNWHPSGPKMQRVSDVGNDWMIKALYEDPKWRLYGHSALKHPWLSQD